MKKGQSSTGLQWAALSDQGRRRKNNEDAWGAWSFGQMLARMPEEPRIWPAEGFLLMVSDGMGGAKAGEVASQFCVERLARELYARRREPDRGAAMRTAFVTTHEALMAEADADPLKEGMGATLSALWLLPDGAYWFGHVGDSRIHAGGPDGWQQLTEDQSVGAGMVRRGEMSAEDVNRLRYRSMLEQVMGGAGAPLEPQIGRGQWSAGLALALCSDGLYGPLGDDMDEYYREALARPNLTEGARWLVEQANDAGGPDNITVLLARFVP
ncbi:MAG TPA: protein phosphatase 2C domain-containing protein [Opitutaceae bacterium]|nr:protein phosphatase 2C domain-containing protein [Opitutaceae bacterium]HRJ47257.1 protein phosphatase 2C domain-containing protein [Opitutaceae bacterium]